ncbi:DUF6527 family protein [Afipia sp. DC4300-2b1]|uniref:DUF6527 family protein n=1 Tax=Afipia sp. DC4300-2b1 TaxID=2804672 RepID=UPI003CEA6472
MTVWQTIWGFWLWLLTRLGLRRQTFRTLHVTDIPEALQAEKVYVAGEDGYAWSAAMLCPGGCGEVLEMNLLPDARPCWKIAETGDDLATLHPSVWLKTGCGCHFILRNGKVRWV